MCPPTPKPRRRIALRLRPLLVTGACVAGAALGIGSPRLAHAAPGDVLFADDFERGRSDWKYSVQQAAGRNEMTAASGRRSLYLRGEPVEVTSDAIDTRVPSIRVKAWIRRGDDRFSENPDGGDDLRAEYLNASGAWVTLVEHRGDGTPGEILPLDETLSGAALHGGFRLRFVLEDGSGGPPENRGLGWDHWHVDNVEISEIAAPQPLAPGRCEEFSAGLAGWIVDAGDDREQRSDRGRRGGRDRRDARDRRDRVERIVGRVGTSSQAVATPPLSMTIEGGDVAVRSLPIDLSGAGDLALSLWIRRGADAFSEDPDRDEDLSLEYLDDRGRWQSLARYAGDGKPGEILTPSFPLPDDARHGAFRLRLRMTGEDGPGWDFWHVDSICLSGASEIAHWRFEEAAWNGRAGEVVDATGHGHDGSAAGGADPERGEAAIEGNPGTCRFARLDGVDDSITIPDSGDLNGTDALTYAAWIRPRSWRGVRQIMGKSVHGGGSGRAQMGLFSEGGRLKGRVETRSGRHEVTTALPPTDAWTHVALVFDGSRVSIVVNGSEVASKRFASTSLQTTRDPFVIGQRYGSADYFFHGDLDDVRIYGHALSTGEVASVMKEVAACVVDAAIPIVEHDGHAQYCAKEKVLVSMVDAEGAPLPDYDGKIELTTQAGVGAWSLVEGSGRLAQSRPDDGVAVYAFGPKDGGRATFALAYDGAETALDVDAIADTERDPDEEGLLAFAPASLTFTATPLPEPLPSPVDDPIRVQTAGVPFSVAVSAMGEGCGLSSAYEGPKTLAFWVEHEDPVASASRPLVAGAPVGTSAASAVARPLDFKAGRASTVVEYRDVGRIRLHALDASSAPSVAGATNAFVVRPADLVVTKVRNAAGEPNPGTAIPTGPLFARAGEPLEVTVEARDAHGAPTPGFGRESVPEGVRLRIASLVAPTGGATGTLADASALSPVAPAGRFRGTTISWSEVGAMRLQATIADGDYLGTGDLTGSSSPVVGRFAPSRFEVLAANAPRFRTPCALGAFGWMGQPFGFASGEAPVLSVRATSASGGTTRNYAGTWWRLTNDGLANRLYLSGTGTLDGSGLPDPSVDPVITSNEDGTGTLRFSSGSGLAFRRTTPIAAFDAEIALSIDVLDEDATAYPGNPFVLGGTGAGSGIAFDVSKRFQYGRLAVDNAHGSELVATPLHLRTQRFDGLRFVDDDSDQCSHVPLVALELTPSPAALVAAPTIANQPLLSGEAGLRLAAPRATGQLDLRVRLDSAGLPWLRYDWPEDGNLDGVPDDDPRARITFGIWKGRDELIFVQETY